MQVNEKGMGWGLGSVWIWTLDCGEMVIRDNVSSSRLKVEMKIAY